MHSTHFEQPEQRFPLSDSRGEPPPLTVARAPPVFIPPRTPASTYYTAPPPPIPIGQGVWKDQDGVVYCSNWYPVQAYLTEARENKRLPHPPSDLVFALAALEVLDKPHDPVHWLIWEMNNYQATARIVNRIALHQPRLIKTHVPWTGGDEYKNIVACYQEKFLYIHIRREWYPTDPHVSMSSNTSKRRSLRSGDRSGQTVQRFFNMPELEGPPLKRRRRALKEPQTSPTTAVPIDRPRRSKPEARHLPSTSITSVADLQVPEEFETVQIDDSEQVSLAGSVIRPSSNLPDMSPTNATSSSRAQSHQSLSGPGSLPSPPLSLAESVSLNSSHARNRSTSQSSAETLVDEVEGHRRSISVASAATVVEVPSPSKKRKSVDLEAPGGSDESTLEDEKELGSAEGMVTRGRASKLRNVDVDNEGSATTSRTTTPVRELKRSRRNAQPRVNRDRL